MRGERIGNYVVTDLIGEGGMGVVYLAEHPGLGRRAAVKVMKAEAALKPTEITRFFNEARAANAIGHPGIVAIFDYGQRADGSPYLLMEALGGESLAARLRRLGRLPLTLAVEIARQVADAMGAAHRAGIIHRDLKPENLFLTQQDGAPDRLRVKVLDFGIAKLQPAGDTPASLTHSGTVLGTPLYMSPEQCRGTGLVDARSDIYALGAILFEMLTGRPPFESRGFGELVHMHISQPPPPVRWLRPDAPPDLEELVLCMLAKDREQRVPSMEQLTRRLEALELPPEDGSATVEEQAASLATQPTTPAGLPRLAEHAATASERPQRPVARRRVARGLGLALAAALLALALGSIPGAEPAKPAAPSSAKTRPAPPPESAAVRDASERGPAAAAGALGPAASEAGALAQAALVELRITSLPPGASVWDARGKQLLGTTPLVLTRPRDERPLQLRITKRGYASVRATLELDRDRELVAPLTAAPGAAPAPSAVEPASDSPVAPSPPPPVRRAPAKI